MANIRHRDPLLYPCRSTQTTRHSFEIETCTNTGGQGPYGGITDFDYIRNGNYLSFSPQTDEARTLGKFRSRMQPTNNRVDRQNHSTCSCFFQNDHHEQATEITKTADRTLPKPKPHLAPKNICTKCHDTRGETSIDERGAGSVVQFYEFYEEADSQSSVPSAFSVSTEIQVSQDVLKQQNAPNKDFTPNDVMNSWIPVRGRPTKGLLPTSENYIDVSPRGFSLRKYFPELFLNATERNEMRAAQGQELQGCDAATLQKKDCTHPKCLCGNFNDVPITEDWRSVIENVGINAPCPWRDEEVPVTTDDYEEIRDVNQSSVKLTSSERPRKWLWWSYDKFKRDSN
nr:uncharacterized protein LOC124223396 [Neodiprion pinetum]XP_046491268.1 uncharacterized protein LOC124223396 [Neodiprion pinetum]XP_046491269.1 uncharacterized protein LOC124223396 [Neodiprion pinetum]